MRRATWLGWLRGACVGVLCAAIFDGQHLARDLIALVALIVAFAITDEVNGR